MFYFSTLKTVNYPRSYCEQEKKNKTNEIIYWMINYQCNDKIMYAIQAKTRELNHVDVMIESVHTKLITKEITESLVKMNLLSNWLTTFR